MASSAWERDVSNGSSCLDRVHSWRMQRHVITEVRADLSATARLASRVRVLHRLPTAQRAPVPNRLVTLDFSNVSQLTSE